MNRTAGWGILLFIYTAMKRKSFLLFFLLFCATAFPQQFTRSVDYAQFTDSLTLLQNVFSGGQNNIRTQFADIDGDGDPDMIFLDGDGTFGWYKNAGTPAEAVYILQTEFFEGGDMLNWFRLADTDGDGDLDLFTGASDNQVRYFQNTGTAAVPRYTLTADPLLTATGQPVISESGCHPAFTDADGDGDLDFVTGNSTGTLLFVHASVDPSRPLSMQGDIFWWDTGGFDAMTEPFNGFTKVIRGYDHKRRGVNLEHPHAVTIDGGCGFGGPLAAVCFSPTGEVVDRIEV